MDHQSFLARTYLFKGFTDQDFELFLRVIQEEHFAASTTIVTENSPGSRLYIVKSGTVDVLKKRPMSWGIEEIRIARLTEGEVVGELSVLDNRPRSSTVKAFDNCILLSLEKSHLEDIIAHHPATGCVVYQNIIERLSQRLRDADDAIRDLSQSFFH